MSVHIGEVDQDPLIPGSAAVHVSSSRSGVEILTEKTLTLQPTYARNYAALLVRAADEVERMRRTGIYSVEPREGL